MSWIIDLWRSEGRFTEFLDYYVSSGSVNEVQDFVVTISHGGAHEHQIRDLGIYARNIGVAFQVADDILNVEGDADTMGKAVGSDADRGKNTYPSLLGIDRSKALALELVTAALKVLEDFDSRSDPLRAIARYVIERNR